MWILILEAFHFGTPFPFLHFCSKKLKCVLEGKGKSIGTVFISRNLKSFIKLRNLYIELTLIIFPEKRIPIYVSCGIIFAFCMIPEGDGGETCWPRSFFGNIERIPSLDKEVEELRSSALKINLHLLYVIQGASVAYYVSRMFGVFSYLWVLAWIPIYGYQNIPFVAYHKFRYMIWRFRFQSQNIPFCLVS